MRKGRQREVHPPGILERIVDRMRGREQVLVRGPDERPLLLISYPRGRVDIAQELERVYLHRLESLRLATREMYAAVLRSLPTIIVVLLRPRNPCGCLGHHHPRGAESRLTKRLAYDLGSPIGEIDLAYEGIRDWRPQPLSSMALGEFDERLAALHFQAALLAVLLHELEHLAFPENSEQATRHRSDSFYTATMEQLVAEEIDTGYGMAGPSLRP